MTSHTYHTTATGHPVQLTVHGREGPVLITIHGGGLVRGSRRDVHIPQPIHDAWPGRIVAIDHRLLVPSNAFDILEDMKALFAFLPKLNLPMDQLFIMGFSGGGYPLRLAALLAAEEARKPRRLFTVRGCVSFFGMGGDLLHDYWFTPQRLTISKKDLSGQQEEWQQKAERWAQSDVEYSDAPAAGLGSIEGRNELWEYWHMTGTINDAITGEPGFSKTLACTSHENRSAQIPIRLQPVYPQFFMERDAGLIPPFFIVHGDADKAVPFEESLNTAAALERGGGQVEFRTIRGGDHALKVEGVEPEETLKVYKEVVEWMLAQL